MAKCTPGRRTLSFESQADVMADVDRLLTGYQALGNWSLGQVCHHLTGAVVFSVSGFAEKKSWLFQQTIGRFFLRRVLRSGSMPEGVKLPESFVPKPGLDDRAEAEALRAALTLFAGHEGVMAVHPVFGRMDHAQWKRLHLIHGAHHLSFLLPHGSGA